MKRSALMIFSAAVLVLSVTGCQRDSATSTPNVLAGPIPECKELLSAEREAYRATAKESCSSAKTLDERMKNVGCEIVQRASRCEPINTSHY